MSFSEWKLIKLKEVGDVITGKTPSTKNSNYFGSEYYFITPRDMDGQRQITATERYLSKEGLESVNKQVMEGISICVSCIGSDMGKVVICNKKCVTNQQINSITNIKNIYSPEFIYYSLKPMRDYLHNIAGGSTMPIVNKSTFENIELLIPPLEEQKLIANILSTLDEKIEINNQINKKLEEMAQAIFKQWFVDFEFPNKDGEPYKSSGGEMVESDLGMIPKGWKIAMLGDIVSLNYGKALTAKNRVAGDIKVYSSAGHTGFHNKALVESDGIIVGRKGTIGTVNYARNSFYCIDTAYYITQKDCKFDLIWVFELLKQLNLAKLNEDSAVPGLNRNTVYSQRIVVPVNQVVVRSSCILNSISRYIFNCSDENENLTSLRDTLLLKLMSGEIDLKNVEIKL